MAKVLHKFGRLNSTLLVRLLDLTNYYTHNLNPEVRTSYTRLLTSLPLNVLATHTPTTLLNRNDFRLFSSQAKSAYTQASGATDSPSISVNSFKIIMGFILAGLNQTADLYRSTWLERIFFSSQTPASVHLEAVIDGHEGLLWFWGLFEAAQFCVQNRLKTPIGKAQDTFVAIETAIKACSIRLGQAKDESVTLETLHEGLGRVSVLVHFVEFLEKLVYNAYEGTAVGLQAVQKAVKVFFRTNKSTCTEWFWRVRLHLVRICASSGLHELSVRQAEEYVGYVVQHGITMGSEFEIVVIWWVEALIGLRAWQALKGLQIWLAKVNQKRSYEWIAAAAEQSQGR